MQFTKVHENLLVALGNEKWALSTDDSVRAKWRNLLMAIENREESTPNDIHQALVDIASKQGWDEKSQITHLCGYLMSVSTPVNHFREYLQTCADEENVGDGETGYCETCQVPEHDTCSMTDGCPCCEDTRRNEPK